jgi:tetratricopeptide (TPR) repeat protein
MLVWQSLYGRLFTIPQGGGFLLWTRPRILKILFSGFNGLFSWTPITLIGIVGLGFWMRNREKRKTAIILLVLFSLQLYLNSVVYDWHGSWGFGMRRFLDCLPIFILGIATLLDYITNQKVKLLYPALALGLLVLWNYLFLVQYYLHLVARNRPLTFHELVWDKLHIYSSIQRRRLVNTARVSAEKGYMDDVGKALRLAVEIDPSHADIYFVGGQIAASNGDMKTARELYHKALDLGPEDRDVINALENLRLQMDKEKVLQ